MHKPSIKEIINASPTLYFELMPLMRAVDKNFMNRAGGSTDMSELERLLKDCVVQFNRDHDHALDPQQVLIRYLELEAMGINVEGLRT